MLSKNTAKIKLAVIPMMSIFLALGLPGTSRAETVAMMGDVNGTASVRVATADKVQTGTVGYHTWGWTIHKIQTVLDGDYKGQLAADEAGTTPAAENPECNVDRIEENSMHPVKSWGSQSKDILGYTYRNNKDYNQKYYFFPANQDATYVNVKSTRVDFSTHTFSKEMFNLLFGDSLGTADSAEDEAEGIKESGNMPPFEMNAVMGTNHHGIPDGAWDMDHCKRASEEYPEMFEKDKSGVTGLYGQIFCVNGDTIPDSVSPYVSDERNRQEILKYKWSATAKTAIKGRFFIRVSDVQPVCLPLKRPKDLASSWRAEDTYGRDSAEVYTWHTSNEFDVGKGIPASESMENGYVANKGFWQYSWGWSPDVTYNYVIDYPCSYTWWELVSEDTDDDGEDDEFYWVPNTESFTRSITTTRTVNYYAVTELDAYEIQNTKVDNGSYGSATYPGTYKSILTDFDGQSNYDHVTTYGKDYGGTDEDEKHIDPGDQNPTSQISHSGLDYGNTDYDPGEEQAASDYDLEGCAKTDPAATLRVWNDALMINGYQYMEKSEQTTHDESYIPYMKPPKTVNYREVTRDKNSGGDFGQVGDIKTVEIPSETKNGKYPTTLTAIYRRLLPENAPQSLSQTVTEQRNGQNAIYKDFKNNEPVVVHTPVISPVSIKNPEDEVQLVHLPEKDHDGQPLNWLMLDRTYEVSFDPYQWFSKEFGELKGYENNDMTADRYDKYTLRKTVRFPFPVTIKSGGKEYYYELRSDGYTKWIGGEDDEGNFPEGMENEFKFYIPTWAKENTTKFGASTDSAYDIQFRVEAINSDGESDESEEAEKNSELENHVSTYDIYANVSGQIYDFQIVGTNDKDMFAGYSNSASDNTDLSFAFNKEEKKAGNQNRNGGKSVRFTLDGDITDSWDKTNTIPLVKGKSNVYADMGTLWKGSEISYSVKTIGNLSDTNDQIIIKPSFRYVNRDGSVTDSKDIIVYYTDVESGKYIKVAPGKDEKNVKSVSLSSEQFKGSWYQGKDEYSPLWNKTVPDGRFIPDVLKYTADRGGIKEQELLNRSIPSYSASKIVLNSTLRLLTGDPEQLERNLDKTRESAGFDDLTDIRDIPSEIGDIGQDSSKNTRFRDSIQTWYGQYTVPQDLFVYKKTKSIVMPGFDKSTAIPLDTKVDAAHKGYDKDGDGYFTLADYATTGNLSDSSKIWEKDGYLILHFDIESKNNGIEHLIYDGSSISGDHLNRWDSHHENIQTHTTVDFSDPEHPGEGPKKVDVTLKPGDVALIDLRYKLSDKFTPAIQSIN